MTMNMNIDNRFNEDYLALSDNYAATMNEIVLPYVNARRTDQTIAGEDGAPLFVSRFDADTPCGTVMIVHGFTECADKYAELIHSLLRNGYSVVAYDQRGHGRSWRDPEIADRSLTHVDRFEDYVRDMERVAGGVLKGMPEPWALFCHSMGGAVSALFLEGNPGVFSRAAMCAPMIMPNLGGLPKPVAEAMCAGAKAIGRRKQRILGSKPYSGPEDFDTSAASGRARFDWYDAVKRNTPAFQNNGPTYGWTMEAIRANKLILRDGAVEKIGLPVRLYTAERDDSVMPDAQAVFTGRLRDGRRELVRGAKHEIFRSPDEVLFPWWRGVLTFLMESEEWRVEM